MNQKSWKYLLYVVILFLILSCEHNSLIEPQSPLNEYIIKYGGQEGFYIVNINSGKSKNIPAVI